MSGIASLLLGFALALLATAGPPLACLPAAADPARTLPALLALLGGVVIAAWLPLRRDVDAARRALCGSLALALLAAAAPTALAPLARWLHAVPPAALRPSWVFATALPTLGLLGGVLLAVARRVATLPGQTGVRRNLGLFLLGVAAGLPAAPGLAYDLLGLPGAVQGVAALAAGVVALLVARPATMAPRSDALREPAACAWGIAPLVAALVGLGIGLLLTPGAWRLSGEVTVASRHALLGQLALAGAAAVYLPRLLHAVRLRPSAALLVTIPLALLGGPALALGWPAAPADQPPVTPTQGVLALLFVVTGLGAAMPAVGDRRAARRGFGALAIAAAGVLATRLGPIDPPAAARFAGDIGLALGLLAVLDALRTPAATSARSPRHRVAAGLLVMIAIWLARRDAGLSDPPRLAAFEADGTPTIELRDADPMFTIARSGARNFGEAADPRAFRRLMLLGLALCDDAPQSLLVLGAQGRPLVRALLEIQTAPVTWVTPLRGEVAHAAADPELNHDSRLTVVHAAERTFLDHTAQTFDFIALPPPDDRERHGLLLTDEMHALIRSRLTPHGLVVHTHQIAPRSVHALQQRVLMPLMASYAELLLFLDHPRNPRPLLAAVSAAQPIRMIPDRITARLAQLAQQPAAARALSAADLDVRGVIQCFVMDRELLRLFLAPRRNTDARPWLAADSWPESDGDFGALDWLLLRRSSPGDRLVLDPLDASARPVAYQISGKVRYDFQAASHLYAASLAALRHARPLRDPEAPPHPDDDLSAACTAAAFSLDLGVARGPIDRAINDRISRRRLDAAVEVCRQLRRLDASRQDLDLLVAQLLLRSGRIADASAAYQAILTEQPDHATANAELGLLITGQGSEIRQQARPYLHQAMTGPALTEPLRGQVELALAFLDGDRSAVQTLLGTPHLRQLSTPLINYLRLLVAGGRWSVSGAGAQVEDHR